MVKKKKKNYFQFHRPLRPSCSSLDLQGDNNVIIVTRV